MRKNKMMRAASALLVAVLLTTSTISGTFAKYVTQDSASDTARVAKWGVELQVVGNLFGDSYGTGNKIVEDSDGSVTVQSVNHTEQNSDVVAPGTENSGEGFSFAINGSPEVDGEIRTTMTIQNIFLKEGTYGVMIPVVTGVVTAANFAEFEEDLYVESTGTYTKAIAFETGKTYYTLEDAVTLHVDGDDDLNEAYYYPVVYTLAGTTNFVGDYTEDSLKEIADLIATKLSLVAGAADSDTSVVYTGTKSFNSNTNLATLEVNNLNLSWAWAFERKDGSDNVIPMYDGADTILGMLIAKEVTGTAPDTDNYTVVKLSGTSYVGLVEFEDYCLNTKFILDVTIEQVN